MQKKCLFSFHIKSDFYLESSITFIIYSNQIIFAGKYLYQYAIYIVIINSLVAIYQNTFVKTTDY